MTNAHHDTRYDTIVVGSGPGGCVVARRLADAGQRVALVEAGPELPLPDSLRGLSAVGGSAVDALSWPQRTVYYGQAGSSASLHYRQGRALGGSSAINSMVLSPGDAGDYVDWENRAGCVDWGPEAMAPWLDRAVAALPVEFVEPGGVTEVVMNGIMQELDLFSNSNSSGTSSLGLDSVGLVDAALAAHGGQRCTVFDGLISGSPDVATASIDVQANTTVTRVMVDGNVTVGVETNQGRVLLSEKVVLAAGAIGTPELLARSVPDLHQIGQRIVDHPSFVFTVLSGALSARSAPRPSAISKVLRFSSDVDTSRLGDIQVLVIEDVVPADALSVVLVTLLSPNSTGRMSLAPGSELEIQRGCLTTSHDRNRFRVGVRSVAAALTANDHGDSITNVMIDELGKPASSIEAMDDDELDRWLLTHPGPVAHLAGACSMGPTPATGAVTSCQPETAGQVFGVSGLYIADSSVLPGITSGGLQIPVMAVAERIAAGIVGD